MKPHLGGHKNTVAIVLGADVSSGAGFTCRGADPLMELFFLKRKISDDTLL